MSDTPQTWIGQKIGGRYPIESLLGRGGMSSVYKGVDPHLKRPVAIKLIHRHLSERKEWVKRFEQEAASVAKLRHPNIVQVYDFDKHRNSYYMVMEYVAGETLDKRLQALKEANLRMPLGDAIRIMILLCEAIAYAHDQQLIHRDLKPSNVMLNLLGQPVLMDFGIAKLLDGGNVQTATGTTMGTAAYMAPEQITGQEVDHRSDLYALGVIFYEMLNGTPPYEGKSALTVMMKHVNEELPDIRLRNSNLPETIAAVLEKALSKEPNDRFQSGFEMANALRLLLGTTGVHTAAAYSTGGFTPTTSPVPPVYSQPQQPIPEKIQVQAPSEPPVVRKEETAVGSTEYESIPVPQQKRRVPVVPIALATLAVLAVVLGAIFLLPTLFGSTPTSTGMEQIPAGTYTIGQGNGGSQFAASQQRSLEAFWLDRFEVTNADYAAYVSDAGANPPARWPGGVFASGEANHPVQGVMWSEAQAYCEWAGKRLPTEAEWEVAARGPNAFLYPWGNETAVVRLASNSTYPRGGIPANRSPFGIYDMAGNVWEWVDEPYTAVPASERVLRGGAYDFQKDLAYRLQGDPSVPTMFATAGFRCAASEVEVVAEDGIILISDDFTAPDSGWPSVEEGNVLSGYHPPDFYHVQSSKQNHVATAYFGGSYDNISLTTDVFVDSTDGSGDFRYGLIARRTGDRLYAFTVSPRAGTWQVLKGSAAGIQTLQEGSVTGLRGLSENDRLRVDVAGNTLVFAINSQVVTQLTDNAYTAGDIGFWVETFDETRAHVHYDLLEVSQIEAAPVAADVVLQDEFTDPNSGWPERNNNDSLSGYHPPDFYHVQSSRPNHTTVAFLDRAFDAYTLEANVFVDSTDSESGDFYYGLGVHQVDNSYFALLISPRAGQWQVVEQGETGKTVLASGADNSLQGMTASDRLRVDATAGNLLFSLNGRSLAQLDGVAKSQGNIGFVVETLDETRAHIHYDSLTIRGAEQIAGGEAPIVVSLGGAIAQEPAATPEPVVEAVEPTPVPTIAPPTPDVPLPPATGMTQVAGDSFVVGSGVAVTLSDYWIDSYEVTNAQFAAFMEATGQEAPAYWANENIPTEKANHPVRDVTWDVANIYCNWATKRLPTEAEWEVAARGPQGWFYPWGNNRTAVTLPAQDTYPVGSLVANRSYYGAFDMAGNVWEWVAEPYTLVADGNRIIRGGANSFQNDMLARPDGDPANGIMRTNTGIRCASDNVAAVEDRSVLLHDEFANIDSGWFQAREPVDAYFYGYHPTDFYHVQVAAPNDCLTVRHQRNFSNFMAEVRVFIASTDTEDSDFRHGLILRESGNAFYAFTISPRTQVWQVVRGGLDGMTVLAQGTAVTIRGLDQATEDRLFVTANGPEMHFFVNGELVARVVDNAYGAGNIGFLVETLDETYAHIHFDRITVWALPDGVASPPEQAQTNATGAVNPLCRGTISSDDLLLNFTTYTVVQGDTLSSIAGRQGVPLEAILGANGKTIENPRFISVGQTIIIPQT